MSEPHAGADEGYVKFTFDWLQEPVEIPAELFERLEAWRDRLYAAGAIGAYPNGIGFGNISARVTDNTGAPPITGGAASTEGAAKNAAAPTVVNGAASNEGAVRFFITGSATGNFEQLSPEHYALVTSYSLGGNSLRCRGLTKASSESLSHAAIYEAVPAAAAVIHVHHRRLWDANRGVLPTTAESIEYGTPEMALALREVAAEIARGGPAGTGAVRPDRNRGGRRPGGRRPPDANDVAGVIVMGGHEEGVIAFGGNLDEAGRKILALIEELPGS